MSNDDLQSLSIINVYTPVAQVSYSREFRLQFSLHTCVELFVNGT